MCHLWVVEVDRDKDSLWPKLRDTVPAIFVNLGRDMGQILRWGNVEKVAFAVAEPGLDQGVMMGGHWLVQFGVFNLLGKVLLGSLGVSPLPVMLQGATIMLQLNILGTKVFVVLCHLGHIGTKAFHLIPKIPLRQGFHS